LPPLPSRTPLPQPAKEDLIPPGVTSKLISIKKMHSYKYTKKLLNGQFVNLMNEIRVEKHSEIYIYILLIITPNK
jgi:hypothetical protein